MNVKGLFVFDLKIDPFFEDDKKKALAGVELIKSGTLVAHYENTGSKLLYLFNLLLEGKGEKKFDKSKIEGFKEKPKFTQYTYPHIVSLAENPNGNVKLEVTTFLPPNYRVNTTTQELAALGPVYFLFANKTGIRLITETKITFFDNFEYLDKNCKRTIKIEHPLDFKPTNLSIQRGAIALLTSNLKIYLINMTDGKYLYRQTKNFPMPIIKVEFNEFYIVAISITHIYIVDRTTHEEKRISYPSSPTSILLAEKNRVVVGDSHGILSLVDLNDGSVVFRWGPPELLSSQETEISFAKSKELLVGKITKWKSDYILSFQPHAISLWQYQEERKKVLWLDVPGRAMQYKSFDRSVQFRVDDDQFWVWSPDLHLESLSKSPKKNKSPKRNSLTSVPLSLLKRDKVKDRDSEVEELKSSQTASKEEKPRKRFSGSAANKLKRPFSVVSPLTNRLPSHTRNYSFDVSDLPSDSSTEKLSVERESEKNSPEVSLETSSNQKRKINRKSIRYTRAPEISSVDSVQEYPSTPPNNTSPIQKTKKYKIASLEAFIFDKSFDLDNDYSDEISKGRMTGRELHRREHVFFEFYSSSDSSNEETSNTSRSLRNKSNDSTVTKRKSLGQPAKNAISRQFSEGNRRKCRSSVVKVPFGDISEQKERKRSSKVTKSLSMVADDYTVQELGETSEVNSLGKSDGYVSGSDKLTCSERDELGSLSKKTGELSQHTSDTVMEKLQNNNKYRRTKTVGSKTDKIEERPLISFRDSLLLMEYNNQHPQPLNAVKSTQLSSRSNGPSNSIVAPNSIKSKHPRKIERKIKSHENLKKTLIMKRENLQSTPAQLSQSISNSNDTPESPQATKKAKNLPTLPLRTSTSEKQSPPSKPSKPKPLPDLSSLKKKDANDVPPLKSEEETPPPIVKPKPPVPRLPVPQPRSESTITDLASPHKTPTTPHDNKFIKSPRPLPNQPIGDSNLVSTFTPPDGTQKNNTLPVPSPRAANVRRYSAPESPRTPTSPSQVLVSPRPTPPPRPNLITSVTAVRTASRPVPPPKITNSPPRDPQTPSLKILEPTNTTTTTPSTPNNPSATTSTPTTSTSTTTPNHHVSPLSSPKHKPLPLPAQRLSAHSDQPSQQDQPAKAQPPSHKPAPTHPHKQTPTQDTQPHKQEPQRIQTTQNQSHPQTHNKEVPTQPHKQQTPTQVQTPKSQLPKQDPLKGQTPVQPAAQHTPTQAQDKKEVQPTQTTQVQPTAQAHKQEAQRVQTSQKTTPTPPPKLKRTENQSQTTKNETQKLKI